MRIQMITLMAGPEGSLQPGEIADLPAAQAEALIKGGYARPAPKKVQPAAPVPEAEAAPETETIEGGETAVQPRGRGRRGGG